VYKTWMDFNSLKIQFRGKFLAPAIRRIRRKYAVCPSASHSWVRRYLTPYPSLDRPNLPPRSTKSMNSQRYQT